MLPLFEPVLALYAPVAMGLVGLAALAMAGMAVVVVLVFRADRVRARRRATGMSIRSHYSEAA